MTKEEFLARWSRRKREAESSVPAPQTGKPASETPAPSTAAEGASEVDLASLPSIDSITAMTDITAFLREGIPRELTRAALRRAWTADPAIRDFVGLAENAWDFTDPNAMPGFGPLDCSQAELAALVDRIVGGVHRAAETLADAPTQSQQSSDTIPAPDVAHVAVLTEEPDQGREIAGPAASPPITDVEAAPVRRRTHGSALPG
ncbi:DUF3306 domain-containing protein [Bradyrhizobium xenonodulans]|uniref:DUF3306 domain-containing protein n=1 Tax=Bradyrhizobium xenonodulans TaxID=2736875 RepID=A0ABY7MX57_9BRAD|nr:DUF3306 domain-containing protein [Bradyrhizobium xenonodulans]WBL81550.1 DUF3306 domain-containing protein [Bradyrhizobium xenonodulans]